jgi:CheY-like chemotaxis protein
VTGPAARPRILCVDDEPNVLAGLSRTLRMSFDVVTAVGGLAGLETLAKDPASFAVVMSDLRMPGMDGVTFLQRVRHEAPDAVRILLTGQADTASAIGAVNDGQIFRFLLKPCAPEALLKTLGAACEQHRLVTSERVLLAQTLQGCIKALIELLALVQPAAFGRATRVKRHVGALAERLGVAERWQVEIAALLSQVGSLTLPPGVAERAYGGQDLGDDERRSMERLPEVAARLVSNIPRLEEVTAILRHQHAPFMRPLRPAAPAGPGAEPDTAPAVTPRADVPRGARILRAALDFDELESRGHAPAHAIDELESRRGAYDPAVLRALRALFHVELPEQARVEDKLLSDIRLGMVFAVDVVAPNGLLLIARGQEVTPSLVERVRNNWYRLAAAQQVRMIIPGRAALGATQAPPADARQPVEV